jgi:hypothetical protein
MHATATSLRPTTRRIDPRWRVVDIVVASVLGVASALFFFAGLGPRQFLRRTLPVAIVADFAATTILLCGHPARVIGDSRS